MIMLASLKKSKIVTGMKRMMSNESGNMAIVAAFSVMPLLLTMGAAVDFERASNLKVALQGSVDAAALYAASLSDTTDTGLTDNSKSFFTANFNSSGGQGTPAYAVTPSTDSVTAVASVDVPNSFMKLFGYPKLTVSAKSVVKKDKQGINLEISLVLDNTGSMGWINSQTGNSAIYDLKAAATKFVNQVMPDVQDSYYTKIAAIPYNVGVNLGSSAAAISARGSVASGTSTSPGSANYTFSSTQMESKKHNHWQNDCTHDAAHYCLNTAAITNCVTERTGTHAFDDMAAATYPLGRQYVVDGATGSNGCNVTPMRPLSTSKTDLNATIAAMSSSNNTVGQIGIGWGWYTLSPNINLFSGASVPSGYDKLTTTDPSQKVKKIMILMTDGEYNSAYADGVMSGQLNYVNYDDSRVINKAPDNGDPFVQSKSMCTAIKATGIELYVITFQLDQTKPARVDLATSCATDAEHLIDADSTSLDAAFSKIANKLQQLRIAG